MNRHLITLLRPHQWLKNIFVLMPLFFGGYAAEWDYVRPGLLACLAFCLAAGGVYCFNDIHDVASDRLHREKRLRPIACGSVSIRAAYAAMAVVWALAFALVALDSLISHTSRTGLAVTLLFYIVMNVVYCVKLKHIAILDVFVIATGFVLRIVAGGAAMGIVLSHWIVLTTFLLALFLALAKRFDDVAIYDASGLKTRESVGRYNMAFLGLAVCMLGSVTIMCYILYTVSDNVVERIGSPYLYATSVFVVAGILRYLQLALVDHRGGSPTQVLLHDRFVQACVVGWLATFAVILYV